ncbi:hypothetical protein [Aneurinibacillus terranovensis]|uniref:hypothetical protein n=1 Tax=Aneurinibacillus terranovensis TaxID=278991 RepID=UPI0003FD9223|nr:hypothetical protein [Aneurinibacillus terranovensis]
MEFANIKQVQELNDVDAVNQALEKGWVLLSVDIVHADWGSHYRYCLGLTRTALQEKEREEINSLSF